MERTLTVQYFGSSHEEKIGVRIAGFPANFFIDLFRLQNFVDLRKPSYEGSTARTEDDRVIFEQGVNEEGKTDGKEIIAYVYNQNVRKDDYKPFYDIPRPSHADYVSLVKFGKEGCLDGGSVFSGRMTLSLCIAGGIFIQYLQTKGIDIVARVFSIGGILNTTKDTITKEQLAFIRQIAQEGDSVGGSIDCFVHGCEIGMGELFEDGLESRLSSALFAIPAVKGVEFGLGTRFASKKGSEVNDCFAYRDGKVITLTNNSGGINGGISNGMPITMRVTFRPAPSIRKPQHTLNLTTKEMCDLTISGRHDACFVPRALPAVQSAVAQVLCSYLIKSI